MCHTLLQHYVTCTHTDVAFIPCCDVSWYPSHKDDGLDVEWRDHSRLRGVAHSYRRQCRRCLDREWDTKCGVEDRRAIDGWQRFVRDLVSEGSNSDYFDEAHIYELVSTSRDDTSRNVRSGDMGSTANSSVMEDETARSLSLDRASNEQSTDSSSSLPQARQSPIRAQGSRSHRDISDDVQALLSHCESYVKQAIASYPGLEAWSLEDVDGLLTDLFPQLELPRITVRLSSRITAIQPEQVESFSVGLLLQVVADDIQSGARARQVVEVQIGRMVLMHGASQLFRLSQTGSSQVDEESARRNRVRSTVRLVVQWLSLFLSLHHSAYDEHIVAEVSATNRWVDPYSIMSSGWNKYTDFLRDGPSDATRDALVHELPVSPLIDGLEDDFTAQLPSDSPKNTRCNNPDHICRILHDTPMSELLTSKQHGSDPKPYADEVVQLVAATHEVLFHFADCGHYNGVVVEKLSMSVSEQPTASCGCYNFPAEMLLSQRVFSLESCLLCRHNTLEDETDAATDHEHIDQGRTWLEKFVRHVKPGRVVDLWPFDARST